MEDGSFNIELINTRNLNLNKNHNILEFVSKSFKMKKKALDDVACFYNYSIKTSKSEHEKQQKNYCILRRKPKRNNAYVKN